MAFSAVHCGKRGAQSILTHYATVMKAYVQRQTGNGGKKKSRKSNNKISVRNWSHLSALVRVQPGEKTSHRQSDPLIVLLFSLSRNFQKQHRNCFRVQPPYGLAERLGMGLRSVSYCAFVIKHARTLYRLLTALITGNYRSAGPVGVPILPKHPVSNVSSGVRLNPSVPALVSAATAER